MFASSLKLMFAIGLDIVPDWKPTWDNGKPIRKCELSSNLSTFISWNKYPAGSPVAALVLS